MASGSAVNAAVFVRFDLLPEPLLRFIALALPADTRAIAACVCRASRAFLADSTLWQELDLTPGGGVAAASLTKKLARGAAKRAAGKLRVLSMNCMATVDLNPFAMVKCLVEVVVCYGAKLQRLNTDIWLEVRRLDTILAAAPQLQVLNARVLNGCPEVLPVIRNDPPYGPVRVSQLHVLLDGGQVALAAAVAAHESLKSRSLWGLQFTADGLNALLDAATQRGVTELKIDVGCVLNAEGVTALARLLRRGSLVKLDVVCAVFPRVSERSMLELCAALRACGTLMHLQLQLNSPACANRCIVTELVNAAATLPALTKLVFSLSRAYDRLDFGRALGALLTANLPSLRELNVGYCHLGDDGMTPLLDGLAANTQLRKLDCHFCNVSMAFERDRVKPALASLTARVKLSAVAERLRGRAALAAACGGAAEGNVQAESFRQSANEATALAEEAVKAGTWLARTSFDLIDTLNHTCAARDAALAAAARTAAQLAAERDAAQQRAANLAAALASITAQREAERQAKADSAAQIAAIVAERNAAAKEMIKESAAAVNAARAWLARLKTPSTATPDAATPPTRDLAGVPPRAASLDAATQAATQLAAVTAERDAAQQQRDAAAATSAAALAFVAAQCNAARQATSDAMAQISAVAAERDAATQAASVAEAQTASVAAERDAVVDEAATAGRSAASMMARAAKQLAAVAAERDVAIVDGDAAVRALARVMAQAACAAAVHTAQLDAVAAALLSVQQAAANTERYAARKRKRERERNGPEQPRPFKQQGIPTHYLAGVPPSTGTHYVFHGGVAQRSTAWPTALRGVQKPRGPTLEKRYFDRPSRGPTVHQPAIFSRAFGARRPAAL